MNNNKAPNEADFTSSDFLSSNAFDYMNWKDVVGYRSGMFSAIDADGKKFAGATEIVYDGVSICLQAKLTRHMEK